MRGLLILALCPGLALADTLVATRTLRAMTVLTPADMALIAGDLVGGISDPAEAEGKELRVTLYAGRPIRQADIGPPAIIDRNQIVPLIYAAGGLSILAEGRALARGGVGDVIRVMNLASRTTLSGRVGPDGQIWVGPATAVAP